MFFSLTGFIIVSNIKIHIIYMYMYVQFKSQLFHILWEISVCFRIRIVELDCLM